MGNKFKRLIMFLIIVLGIGLFANEEKKAPNEIIKDNPDREVTTVESMKVRDHATMSLTVTKKKGNVIEGILDGNILQVKLPVKDIPAEFISKEVLKRGRIMPMARSASSAPRGKRLILSDGKTKKVAPQARMAMSSTGEEEPGVVNRFPTQEEMNNLTPEKIRELLANKPVEAPAQDIVESGKEYLISSNETGTTIEVFDVKESDNLVFNVQEDGKITETYKVDIKQGRFLPRANPSPLQGYLVDKVLSIKSGELWLADKNKRVNIDNGGISKVGSLRIKGNNLSKLVFEDNFLGKREINLVLNDTSAIIGTTFKVEATSDVKPSAAGVHLIPHVGSIGSNNEAYTDMEIGTSTENTYSKLQSVGTFYTKRKSSSSSIINSFKSLTLREIDKNSTITSPLSPYMRGKIANTGFEYSVNVEDENAIRYPGVYTTETGKELTAEYYAYSGIGTGQLLMTTTLNNIKIDIGDSEHIKNTDGSSNMNFETALVKRYSKEPNYKVWDNLTDNTTYDQKISFMSKNDDGDLGLWLVDSKGKKQRLKRYQNNANVYTLSYEQGVVTHNFKVRVSQADGQWAKVEVLPDRISYPGEGIIPFFEFRIIQGKRVAKGNESSEDKIVELRKIHYVVEYNPIKVIPYGSVITTIDERVRVQIEKGNINYMSLGGRGSLKKNNMYSDSDPQNYKDFSKFVHTDYSNLPKGGLGLWIDKVSSVTKNNVIQQYSGIDGRYMFFGDIGFELIQANGEDRGIELRYLNSGGNVVKAYQDFDEMKVIFIGNDSKYYSIFHKFERKLAPENETGGFYGENGYITKGGINLGVYTAQDMFLPVLSETTDAMYQINGALTSYPNFKDINNSEVIANKYEVILGQNSPIQKLLGEEVVLYQNGNQENNKIKIKLESVNNVTDGAIKLYKGSNAPEEIKEEALQINYYYDDGKGVKILLGEIVLQIVAKDNVNTNTLNLKIDPRIEQKKELWITEEGAGKRVPVDNAPVDLSELVKKQGKISFFGRTNYDNYTVVKNIATGEEYTKTYGPNENSVVIFSNKNGGEISFINKHLIEGGVSTKILRKYNPNETEDIEFFFNGSSNITPQFARFQHHWDIDTMDNGFVDGLIGYRGSGIVNLEEIPTFQYYTLVEKDNPGSSEVKIIDPEGTLPNFNGLDDVNVADYYKVTVGNYAQDANIGTAIAAKPNSGSNSLVDINLTTNGEIQVQKPNNNLLNNLQIKIEYYHQSGIKLGEYNLTVYNPGEIQQQGVIETEVDPRMKQKEDFWFTMNGAGGYTLDTLKENAFEKMIKIVRNDLANKNVPITNLLKVESDGLQYLLEEENDYNKYVNPDKTTAVAALKKTVGNINALATNNNFTRKYEDKDKKLQVTFVGNNRSNNFAHHWKLIQNPSNFTPENGYTGSGSINLSEYATGKSYTIVSNTPSTDSEIQLISSSGTLPNVKGLVQGLTNINIATKYSINGNIKELGSSIVVDDNFEINLTTEGKINVKKLSNKTMANKTINIEYYYDVDDNNASLSNTAIKLGNFDLTVSNESTDIGEVAIKLDQRITKLTNGTITSWVGLNGDLSSLGYDLYPEAVKEFIETSGNFSGYGNGTDTVNKIIEVNGIRTSTNPVVNKIKYAKFGRDNEGAFPIKINVNSNGSNGTDISISEFVKTGTDSKLVISRYDSSSSMHDGNNKFVLKTNTGKVLEGNIKELYMDRRGNTSGQVSASTEVKYMGEGKINLSVATPNQVYTFNRTSSDNIIKSNEGEILLEMTSGEILDGSTPGRGAGTRVANKLTVGGQTVQVSNSTATLEVEAIPGKVKIGIDNSGNLTITKLSTEEITATPVTIEYLYKIAEGIEIPLGQFILTIESTKKDLGSTTIKADGRLVKEKTNLWWYRADGRAFRDLNSTSESQAYPEMLSIVNFTNTDTTGINSDNTFIVDSNVTGKTDNGIRNLDGITYGIYGQSQGSNDISFPKYGLRADELLSKLMIKRSGKGSYNFNVFTSTTHYVGNINQQIVDLYHDSTANMDLTGVDVNTVETWDSESTGDSTSNGMTMTFNNSGKLFLMDNMDKTKGIVTHYKAYVGTTEPTATTSIITTTLIKLGTDSTDATNDIEISFVKNNSKHQLQIKKLTDEEMSGTVVIIPYYEDIPLGKLTLTVTNTARDAGAITFNVDSRLSTIAGITPPNVNWITASGMYGTWSDKYNYKAFLTASEDGLVKKTDGSLVLPKDTIIASIESIEGSTSLGNDPTYKTYHNGSYNELALKEGQVFSTYISGDSLMFSPQAKKDLEIIVKDNNGNRYSFDVVVTIVNEEYLGNGKLNIFDAVVGNPYTFSKPTSGEESISGVLTMTEISNFPEIEVSNGTDSVKANILSVAAGSAVITEETSNTAIGGKAYKIDNKISVEITTDGKIKVTRLVTDSFEYKGANAIVIKYLYDVSNRTLTKPVVGSFRLEITDEKTFEEIGTVTFKIDARMAQIMNTTNTGTFKAWTGLDGKIRRKDGTDPENFSDFISSTGSFTNFDSTAVILDILEINGEKPASEGKGGYTANGYKSPTTTSTKPNEAAMPFATDMTMSEFTNTDKESSKLIISRDNMYDGNHTGKNIFLLEAEKMVNGKKTKVKYKGNLQEKYIKLDDSEIVHIAINDIDNLMHKGSGKINLAPLKLTETYSFDVGLSGNLNPISGTNKEDIKLVVPTNSKSLNARGLFTGNKRVANKMIITVAGTARQPVKAAEDEALIDTILNEKVIVGIDKFGRLRINKNLEGDIDPTNIKIDYYYDPVTTTNAISSTAIQLGTFDLTIENPVVDIGTRTVKIDKRFADAPLTTGHRWLLGDGIAKVELNGNNTDDLSSVFKYIDNFNLMVNGQAINSTIERALRVDGRDEKIGTSGEYIKFQTSKTSTTDEAAVLNSGNISELNDKVIVSRDNGNLLNNTFYILANDVNDSNKQKVYIGSVTEEVVGEGKTTGTGTVVFRSENNDKPYTFAPGATGEAIGINADGTTMTITVAQNEKLLDGAGYSDIQSGKIANKITVTNGGSTLGTGNSPTVDGITFGISDEGGLTITKSSSVSLTEDKTYTIKFFFAPNSTSGQDIELSTFDLTVKKTEAKPIGDITFEVDPRLIQISSTQSGSIKWISGDKMFGSWSSKKDYSKLIYTKNTIVETTNVDYVDAVIDKFRGTYDGYTIFKTAETGGYNIIAFKTGVALNTYLTDKNLMLSPDVPQTFETIFEGTDGNKYKANIILKHATGVSQGGYSGSGTLDITDGITGSTYEFSKPTNNEKSISDSSGLLSMTNVTDFIDIYGVVTDQTGTVLANAIEVSARDVRVNVENDSSGLDGNKYKVGEDLEIILNADNKLKITKLSDEFDYTAQGKEIIITYKYTDPDTTSSTKYEDITLGTFTLKIKSTSIDIGTVDFKMDARLSQIIDKNTNSAVKAWTGLDGKIRTESGSEEENFADFITSTGIFSNYVANAEIKNIVKINGFATVDNGAYTATGYKSIDATTSEPNEAAMPFSNGMNMQNFVATDKGNSKLIISRKNMYDPKHTGKNDFVIRANVNDNGKIRQRIYKGNIQEQYVKLDGSVFYHIEPNELNTLVHIGSGSINLAPLELTETYSFPAGSKGEISPESGTNKSIIKLIVPDNSSSLDARGLFDKGKSIANKMIVTVNNVEGKPVKANTNGALVDTILDKKIIVGIDKEGRLRINKNLEEKIIPTKITIDYYYDPVTTTDTLSSTAIQLGTFDLTIENPVVNVGTRTVAIDKRFADFDKYNWLLGENKAKSTYNGSTTTTDLNSLFLYKNTKFDALEDATIEKALRIVGRPEKVGGVDEEYLKFKVSSQEEKDQAAVLNKGNISELNDKIMISKKNSDNLSLPNNEFYILAKDSSDKYKVYKGNVVEEIVGEAKTTGSGTIMFRDTDTGVKYNFPITYTTGITTVEGTSQNSQTLTMTDVSGDLPNGMSLSQLNSGGSSIVLANKVVVFKGDTKQSSTTVDGVTYEIDSTTSGLSITKTNAFSLSQDTVHTIKFYYLPNGVTTGLGEGIELSSFDLTVRAKERVELGEVEFKIDKRLYQANDIYFANGGKSDSVENLPQEAKYPKMINIENFTSEANKLTGDDTIMEVSSKEFPNKVTEITYNGVTYEGLSKTKDGTAKLLIPKGIALKNFKNSLFIAGDIANYSFELVTNTNKEIKGKVKIANHYARLESSATLNLTGVPKNTSGIWESKSTGASNNSSMRMEFGDQKTLFDMKGYNGETQITNNFSYSINNKVAEVDKIEASIDLNDNTTPDIKVAFVSDGLEITKLTNEVIDNVVIEIIPKYQDVEVGKLSLTIINTATSLGDITVEVDRRLAEITDAHWVGVDGNLYNSNGVYGEYSGLVGATIDNSSITNVANHNVKDIETINDKTSLDSKPGNRGDYKHWTDANNGKNKLALPYGNRVTLGNYDIGKNSLLVVSKEDLVTTRTQGNSTNEIEHTFTLTATDPTQITVDNLYSGTLKEKYVGSGVYSGNGTIDITKLDEKTFYTFDVIKKDDTIVGKEGNKTVFITNVEGDPVNTLGLVNGKTGVNIANKLYVKFTDSNNTIHEGVVVIDTITSSITHDGLTIGIDKNSGGLMLKRAKASNIGEVEINYYYDPDITKTGSLSAKKVLLGTFILALKNPEFAIVGNDTLNFGTMIPGHPRTIGGNIDVTNPANKDITFEVEPIEVMTLNGKHLSKPGHSTDDIPKDEILNIKDIWVSNHDDHEFYISATADPHNTIKKGEYRGEIQVTVTITDSN